MPSHQEVLTVPTAGVGFTNITEQVAAIVTASGVTSGLCTVFVQHTSASLVIQENADPAVLRDLEAWMRDTVPELRRWEHAEEGPDDMPAHVRSVLTRTSESIPIRNGRLALGTWQGLYLWEHRGRAHQRHIVVHVQA